MTKRQSREQSVTVEVFPLMRVAAERIRALACKQARRTCAPARVDRADLGYIVMYAEYLLTQFKGE